MAKRFYYASDGVVAYVMKLIRYGTYLALSIGQEKLDLKISAIAFEKYVKADRPSKVNPFITEQFEIKETSPREQEFALVATNNRIQPSSKSLKVSDVLTR